MAQNGFTYFYVGKAGGTTGREYTASIAKKGLICEASDLAGIGQRLTVWSVPV